MRKHEMSGSDSSLSSLGNSLSSMFSFKRGVKARNMAGKRMGKRERHGESESSKVTLETVLSDQPKARMFESHLKKECAAENLDFYQAVQKYKSDFSDEDRLHGTPSSLRDNSILNQMRKAAFQIYHKYICEETSEFPINLSAKVRRPIVTFFENKHTTNKPSPSSSPYSSPLPPPPPPQSFSHPRISGQKEFKNEKKTRNPRIQALFVSPTASCNKLEHAVGVKWSGV
ncbi:hypothetical protein AAMO2058_001460100 [Amorphochlora amoebiformis]